MRTARLYSVNMIAYEHAGGEMRVGGLGDSRLHGSGDISQIMPLYAYLGRHKGVYKENYRMDDPHTAYTCSQLRMASTIIDSVVMRALKERKSYGISALTDKGRIPKSLKRPSGG